MKVESFFAPNSEFSFFRLFQRFNVARELFNSALCFGKFVALGLHDFGGRMFCEFSAKFRFGALNIDLRFFQVFVEVQ